MDTLLRGCWHISENKADDSFVGIQINELGKPNIVFPVGFHISKDTSEQELRADIILLMNTLSKYEKSIPQKIFDITVGKRQCSSAIFAAYYRTIMYYIEYGYYRDKEIVYQKNGRGTISWGRTIKKISPLIDHLSAYYLDFINRHKQGDDDSLIYKINKYCVKESLKTIGWLFPGVTFSAEDITFNKNMFKSILLNKLHNTFDDKKQHLFRDMLTIVDGKDSINEFGFRNIKLGTERFEYVWEKMIDELFGEPNKKDFFPESRWIIGGESLGSSFLRPDTIMEAQDSIYILDAKYYKFGYSELAKDLPGTSSINKQITYGEYAETLAYCQNKEIYNFFILPSNNSSLQNYSCVGYAVSDWKNNSKYKEKPYHKVYAILADVKTMMQNYVYQNSFEKHKLVDKLNEVINEQTL